MRTHVCATVCATLLTAPGCVVDAPFDPDGLLGISNNIENLLDDLAGNLADPLGAKPFPRLLASDGEQLFYATNLTDLRIRFRGRGNDLALPSVVGPTNVYQLVDGEREVVSLLEPTLGVIQMDTDGRHLVSLQAFDIGPERFRTRVLAEDLLTGEVITVAEPAGDIAFVTDIAVAGGRLAYVQIDMDGGAALRVADLLDPDAPEIELPIRSNSILRMRADRLAYVDRGDDDTRLMLHDFSNGRTQTVAERTVFDAFAQHFLTANAVVWSEFASVGQRVSAYDIPTGEARVIADALPGTLAGATDQFLLAEERLALDDSSSAKFEIHRLTWDGERKRLADFPADGFAGQARVVGDDAVWVNHERRIVIQPLAGGSRQVVKPF